MSPTESRDSWSCDHVICKKALFLPLLAMVTENVVNLEKTSEISPIKDEFLAGYSKQNFW